MHQLENRSWVERHGAGWEVSSRLTSLTFTGCSGGEPTSPVAHPGDLEIPFSNGSIRLADADIVIHKTLFGTCTFETALLGTSIGTLTTTAKTGGNATLDIAGTIPSTCGNGTWEGAYKVTNPSTLFLD